MPEPRVLFLTHQPPWPPSSGDTLRNWSLMKELAGRGWQVSVFSLSDGPERAETTNRLREVCEEVTIVPCRFRSRGLRGLTSTLRGRPFQLDYFWDSAASQLLEDDLAQHDYDVIMVQQLYMYRYLPATVHDRCVLDTHNAEAKRMATIAAAAGLSPRGVVAKLQSKFSRALEQQVSKDVGHILAVSEEDAAFFRDFAGAKVSLVPNGADFEALASPEAKEQDLLFVGSLDYSANEDAVSYFIESVLPGLDPATRFTVVGRRPGARLQRLAAASDRTVRILGFVEDLEPWYRTASVFVAPLRSGGGTRLKILEAISKCIPIISTGVGCEGLGLVHGEHLLIADTTEDFIAGINVLLADAELRRRLSAAAFSHAASKYDWTVIGEVLDETLRCFAKVPARRRDTQIAS